LKPPANTPQPLILALRQQLLQLNAWPEAGDLFLDLARAPGWQSPQVTKEEVQWLPRVVEDALQGIDLGVRYPAFFKKLVVSDELCRVLLDALERRIGRGS